MLWNLFLNFRKDCDPGYYSLGNQKDCTICDEGYSCPSNIKGQTICQPGYYSAAGSTNCTACESGYYCPEPECKSYFFQLSPLMTYWLGLLVVYCPFQQFFSCIVTTMLKKKIVFLVNFFICFKFILWFVTRFKYLQIFTNIYKF
jgi:hypothetical protein